MFEAPVYLEYFITTPVQATTGFRTRFLDREEGNDWEGWLRPATMEEAMAAPQFYIAVAHELSYPYAAYDAEEILEPLTPGDDPARWGDEPRRFAAATFVATPKMALI